MRKLRATTNQEKLNGSNVIPAFQYAECNVALTIEKTHETKARALTHKHISKTMKECAVAFLFELSRLSEVSAHI